MAMGVSTRTAVPRLSATERTVPGIRRRARYCPDRRGTLWPAGDDDGGTVAAGPGVYGRESILRPCELPALLSRAWPEASACFFSFVSLFSHPKNCCNGYNNFVIGEVIYTYYISFGFLSA